MMKRKNNTVQTAGVGRNSDTTGNINLTHEQSSKFQDVRNAFFEETAGLRSDISKKEQEMDVLMLEKILDEKKSKQLHDEIYGLHALIAQKRLQAQFEARKDAI